MSKNQGIKIFSKYFSPLNSLTKRTTGSSQDHQTGFLASSTTNLNSPQNLVDFGFENRNQLRLMLTANGVHFMELLPKTHMGSTPLFYAKPKSWNMVLNQSSSTVIPVGFLTSQKSNGKWVLGIRSQPKLAPGSLFRCARSARPANQVTA